MGTAVHLGLIVADPSKLALIQQNHSITLEEIRDALQWPAKVRVAEETHPEHGWRVIAVGASATGREVIAALLPEPAWAGLAADTWRVRTARWLL